ncbi:hypothetical protein [Flavobacterium litorale]|uniref:Uncharacterized protein n=1 Tax=Flavobacterium litorale TaxID=2856519 RepID=A0ABX8V8J2_9FLAO|nr:hypothetical protein [Flavobacterium litorale]QYJ68837.1 hypothetical protein K1I41_02855 [Flavobacterium litorale]
MKKIIKNVPIMLLSVVLLSSCESNNDDIDTTNQQTNEISLKSNTQSNFDLSKNADFVKFTEEYLNNFVAYSYYQQSKLGNKAEDFKRSMNDENMSIQQVENVYTAYGLDFDVILDYQTQANNLVYNVYTSYPEFDTMSEEQASSLIFTEMGEVIGGGQITIDNHDYPAVITPSEIWYCVVEAVGLGIASTIGMKQLKKNGVKIITKALTKTLSKFAGPIGAAIMIIDFGICLSDADAD